MLCAKQLHRICFVNLHFLHFREQIELRAHGLDWPQDEELHHLDYPIPKNKQIHISQTQKTNGIFSKFLTFVDYFIWFFGFFQ
jgi:hypothetical protein